MKNITDQTNQEVTRKQTTNGNKLSSNSNDLIKTGEKTHGVYRLKRLMKQSTAAETNYLNTGV